MGGGEILSVSIETPTPVTVYSYPVEKSKLVTVSDKEVVVFVVLETVPTVKAGVMGCELTGMT